MKKLEAQNNTKISSNAKKKQRSTNALFTLQARVNKMYVKLIKPFPRNPRCEKKNGNNSVLQKQFAASCYRSKKHSNNFFLVLVANFLSQTQRVALDGKKLFLKASHLLLELLHSTSVERGFFLRQHTLLYNAVKFIGAKHEFLKLEHGCSYVKIQEKDFLVQVIAEVLVGAEVLREVGENTQRILKTTDFV